MEMKSTDTLGRRWRYRKPAHPNLIIRPQERDLLWDEMLLRHGPLTSDTLHEFSKHINKSRRGASYRLSALYDARYLIRPLEQRSTDNSNYHDLIYDLGKKGEDALKEASLWRRNTPSTSTHHWTHDFMLACITSSIHLAVLKSDCEYIFHDEIVERMGTFQFPVTVDKKKINLRPDRCFGIRYKNGKERIFFIEADRATERNVTENFNVKSAKLNILMYYEFIGKGEYKKYLGNVGVAVLNIYSSTAKMREVIKLVEKLSNGKGSSFLMYQSWQGHFGKLFKPPKPREDLFTSPYLRAVKEPFDISKV